MTININEGLKLELTAAKHAEALYEAVDINRVHLSGFLPWVGNMRSVEDFRSYIENCELLYQQNKEVSFVIIFGEMLVGRIGLHYINLNNKSASIGYWLTREAEGKGIVTNSCRQIITYGFKKLGLHRIEIKAATENFKSQAIPEKLGFKKEGILRQAELVNDKYLDLFIYSLLDFEWSQETTNR
ncbi:GNAT family N-acetyltransferase [Ginsengibacter hankyongi]|uniref:GNAT family N-acetyltransferase n=1 Tax=Ginsengibacter hankyongi TaxID=2607284 RepID=A0A5J5IJK2_9BACT|nr:GNAT family protein [Ginsengibacter hankyongi]KAA9038545.1 GNAT family N-acetyltransferase [Ginsengibacter hankyongi]